MRPMQSLLILASLTIAYQFITGCDEQSASRDGEIDVHRSAMNLSVDRTGGVVETYYESGEKPDVMVSFVESNISQKGFSRCQSKTFGWQEVELREGEKFVPVKRFVSFYYRESKPASVVVEIRDENPLSVYVQEREFASRELMLKDKAMICGG